MRKPSIYLLCMCSNLGKYVTREDKFAKIKCRILLRLPFDNMSRGINILYSHFQKQNAVVTV